MTLWMTLIACGTPHPDPEPATADAPADRGGRGAAGRFREHEARGDGRSDVDAELEALGYLDGTNPVPVATGATVIDRARMAAGANLFVSGQGPEAHLIDADGTVLHKWAYDWFDRWPDTPVPEGQTFPNHWRRAHLLPDGGLIVVWGGKGLARLDVDSRFVWGMDSERIHHDLDVDPSGDIWTLTRRLVGAPDINPRRHVILDDILVIDPHGTLKRRIPILDCFRRSRYAPMIAQWPTAGDVLHTNTLSVLTGGDPRPEFADGNLLVSFRRTDTLAVIDPVREEVVWALTGQWRAQHQPVLLDSGNLLLFDNRGLGETSRVLEIDPFTQRQTWAYGGEPDQRFFSKILGSVQRLPNGNTLITESDNGRAIEVTREGQRVWEYVVPFTAGANGELVASLYELVRLPADLDLSWADPSTASRTVRARP